MLVQMPGEILLLRQLYEYSARYIAFYSSNTHRLVFEKVVWSPVPEPYFILNSMKQKIKPSEERSRKLEKKGHKSSIEDSRIYRPLP